MTAPPPRPVVVAGGAGGITANRDAIEHLSRVFHDVADALSLDHFSSMIELDRLPALPTGAFAMGYDVIGRADVEHLLGAAIDDLGHAASDTGDLSTKLMWAAMGYPWGTTALDTGLLGPLYALLGTVSENAPGLGLRTVAGHDATVGAGDDRIAGWDPHLVDLVITLAGLPALADLARPDDDGLGVALATGTRAVAAPRSLPDLVTGLADVDRDHPPAGIDVRILDGPQGRRVVVDITGTRTFGNGGHDVADRRPTRWPCPGTTAPTSRASWPPCATQGSATTIPSCSSGTVWAA